MTVQSSKGLSPDAMTSSTAEPPAAAVARVRRRARMSRFLRILLTITVVMHVPVALAVAELVRRAGLPFPSLAGIAWAGAGAAMFLGRARGGMTELRRHETLTRVVDIPYFIHWCAAVWTLLPALVLTLALPLVELARGQPVHLPMGAYMWTYLSGLVVCGYGVLVRRRWFHVVEREVPVSGLDPRLDGLRIAHLSDLHVGTLTPKSWAMRWVLAANGRAPDLAIATGDYVTSGNAFHADVAEALGALRAKLGVFASMGNHDYFADGEPLISKFREHGVRVLRNEGRVVERDGARLWLAAIDDTWTRRDDLAAAMRGRPDGVAAVLLAHDPSRFDAAADAGADLVLSGHTHGGQIAVPFLSRRLSLASIAHPYNVGVYRRGRSTLYVHPGLGTTGPPMRLGSAPEVTILVLRAA
jgi:predicted MPP superfamily phosphohydrolase